MANPGSMIMDSALAALFSVDQTAKTVGFASGANMSHVGAMNVYYKVFYTDYISTISDFSTSPVVFTIAEPCSTQAVISVPADKELFYEIGDA